MTITPLLLLAPDPVVTAAASQKASEPETVTRYPSVGVAVKEVLKRKPQVIGFGEIHPEEGFDYKSTKAVFTDEVLPIMAAKGFRILVLEHLLNDPRIETELKLFYSRKIELNEKQAPIIWGNSNYTDKGDFIRILYRCRSLGIRVHPGGMTVPEANETTKNPSYKQDAELVQKAENHNNKGLIRSIDDLLKKNPKIRLAFYGGIDHNDRKNNGKDGAGHYAARRLAKRYFEVDLIAACEKKVIDQKVEVRNWERISPQNGAAAVDRGNSRIIFFGCKK
jgi:hypothetical protein